MSSPLISVVMSVFNGQAFLAEAVESILNQTFRDFEFVIIDDGSTDTTPEILSRYAASDERVRLLRHNNQGRAASLNIGIRLAAGKYIARMDADDIALPQRLELQVHFMEQHPEVGLLGGAYELINAKGKTLRVVRLPIEDAEIKETLLEDNPICHPTVIMRKEVTLTAGGYRKALLDSDDYDLWLRISEWSRLANLGEPVLRYRVHAAQVSVRNMRHQKECVLAAQASAMQRKRGGPDPLWHVEEVTPQLLKSLGVTEREIQQYVVRGYGYWMELFAGDDPEAALHISDEVLRLCTPESVGRRFLSNTWLTAARIHYKQGRPAKALVFAARAALVRPLVVGRPVKSALVRLAGVFR